MTLAAKYTFISLVLIFAQYGFAQEPRLLWAKASKGIAEVQIRGMGIDANSDVYLTGNFRGFVDIDPGPDTVLLNTFNDNIATFIIKLTGNGDLIWVRKLEESKKGFGESTPVSLALDPAGYCYVVGGLTGDIDADPGLDTALLSYIDGGAFIVKLDVKGQLVWAKNIGPFGAIAMQSVAVDSSHNVIVTGGYQSYADFDPGGDSAIARSTNFGRDAFVLKLDENGNFVWVKTFGGIATDWGVAIAVDKGGSIYSTGTYFLNMDFDPGLDSTVYTAHESEDIYISKLDATGKFLWARGLGGYGSEDVYSLHLDNAANVYVTGVLMDSAMFTPPTDTIRGTEGGPLEPFITKLTSNGNVVWSRVFSASGTDNGRGYSSAHDADGNVYTVGAYMGRIDLDPGPDSSIVTLPAISEGASYVVKLDSNGSFKWGRSIPDAGIFHISTFNNRDIYFSGWFIGSSDLDPSTNEFILTSPTSTNYVLTRWTERPLSVDNHVRSQQPILFPNPTSGPIKLLLGEIDSNIQIRIQDMLGREVLRKTFARTDEIEFVFDEEPGIYVLSLTSDQCQASVKLVVQ
jgi:hypothetical protein